MTLLLTEALALPAWSGVRVLAADDAVAPVVVRHAEVLVGPQDPVRGQGALVAVVGVLDRSDWRIDVLIRRAASADAAALMVRGDEPLGRASALVASRLRLPVLGVGDPLAAAVALQVHLALPELAAARWVTAISTALGAAPPGVDGLVGAVGRQWQRPLWLLDSAGNAAAGPEWDGARAAAGRAGRATSVAEWLQRPVDRGAEFVHLAVPTDHPRGAYLVVHRRPTDDDSAVLAALQVLAPTVAGRLAQQRLAAERDARQRMSLLSELLQSGGRLAADAPRRMLDQGWQLDGWHIGVRIDVPSALDPVALLPEIRRAFADAGVGAQVVENGEGWAAWTTFADQPSQAALQTHAASVRRVQWLLRSNLPTVMGVGSVQPGPQGLVRSLGEAGDAARIAVTRTAGGHLVHVDRLGVGQLLLAWTRTDTFAPAASSLLTPLQGQAGLLETLAAYLEAESSLADTAAVLGVHRNTVSARIARAVDLLGVDLGDPDERLALQLACRSVLSHR